MASSLFFYRAMPQLSFTLAVAAVLLSAACGSDDADSGGAQAQDGGTAVDGASQDGGQVDAGAADGMAAADARAAEDAGAAADIADEAIELIGEWKDPFGSVEIITAGAWNAKGAGYESKSAIVFHDNAANVAVTQSSADDPYTANKFSKRLWTEPSAAGFHYCTVAYGLDSLDLAKASTATADDKDLEGKGCGGFPWSKLSKP